MQLKRITSKEGEVYFINAKTGEKVKTNNTQSGIFAFITLVAATIFMFAIASLLGNLDKESIAAYIINALLIAAGCFIIIRKDPKSIWYVPVICNAFLILAAFIEPTFWRSVMWIPISSGWMLCIIVSILGVQLGKRKREIKSS